MSLRALQLAAALAAGMGAMGGAEVIARPYSDGPAPPGATRARWRGAGNNRKPGKTFAEKKRIRKIAYASKRANRARV